MDSSLRWNDVTYGVFKRGERGNSLLVSPYEGEKDKARQIWSVLDPDVIGGP